MRFEQRKLQVQLDEVLRNLGVQLVRVQLVSYETRSVCAKRRPPDATWYQACRNAK